MKNFAEQQMGAVLRPYANHPEMNRAMAPAPRDQWQPIETAPRDGSNIVLARFSDEEWHGGGATMVGEWDGDKFSVKIGFDDALMVFMTHLVIPWTHWLPLPAPPKVSE
ncbi:hypothetical protein J2Y63_002428 [Shinella sp. BE166]|uniref:hypothetical protein n=1 Tax=Shinella sp. BE166 TaxID=3373918 RepID=UPI003EBA0CDA